MPRKSEQHRKSQKPVNEQPLSNDQLRRLVVDITNQTGIESFVRRMIKLHDALKAGRVEQVAHITNQSRNKSYRRVMVTVSAAVKEKRINVALNIAFYASLYAYENSPDHGREFMRYLDRIRSNSA
ncbi:MAG TPA: hypothetical protein VF131_24580 [Blastocatellia bacterium]|nr:hypothetical protein [Blastocatellia bacterium]